MAFSMYSKIPMPRIEWKEKNMKYVLCYFPFVGLVIGLLSMGCFWICEKWNMGKIFTTSILTILPLLVTGGIHMDGFLDTLDAKSSYRSREDKLRILEDPNVGAFAVIYGIIYILLCFGLFSEVTKAEMNFVVVGYVFSRILSGVSVVTLKKAKKDGMLATTSEHANKSVKWILILECIFCAGIYIAIHPIMGMVCVLAGILVFLYYCCMAYRLFGGVTGDLAGYFLQCCECAILFITVLVGKVLL